MEKEKSFGTPNGHVPNHKETLFAEILGLMEKQKELYDSLKGVLSDEKQQIVSADLKGLAQTGQFKETLLAKIQRLEEERVNVTKELSAILKVPLREMTIGKLIGFSNGYYNSRIQRSRDTLLKLAGQIKQMNLLNKLLVQHILQLIRGSYSFLNQLTAPESVYQSSGGLRPRHQSGKFISDNI